MGETGVRRNPTGRALRVGAGPATDLSNIFFNCNLMEVEGGLVKCNVKAGEAGKPSTRAIDTVVKLKIIEEYS